MRVIYELSLLALRVYDTQIPCVNGRPTLANAFAGSDEGLLDSVTERLDTLENI